MRNITLNHPAPVPGLLLPTVLLLVACTTGSPRHDASGPVSVDGMLQRIHQAAVSDRSAIHVTPLREPGVVLLQQQASSAMIKRDYATAAQRLQEALAREPDSPSLLQAQAELALRQNQWQEAEAKALASWEHGPQLGPLCASNWQTVVEVRWLAGDEAGMNEARESLAQCRAKAVERY